MDLRMNIDGFKKAYEEKDLSGVRKRVSGNGEQDFLYY